MAIPVLVAVSCTTGEPSSTPPTSSSTPLGGTCPAFVLERNGGACVDTLHLDGSTYRVACVAVPEVLLDITLPVRWGRSPVRAITAVPVLHAVAVTGTGDGCGDHALALRTDLSGETASAIVEEVEAAASLPPDLENESTEPAE